MPKRTATNAAPQRVDNMRALAALLDVNASTVARMVKRPDWPFARSAPWRGADIPKMMRWRADALTRDGGKIPAGSDPGSEAGLRRQKLEQEIRKLRAQADQAETALAKERGDLHDADECEVEATRRATLIRNGMQNVAPQSVSLALSHGLPHEAAPGFQKQIEELINGCLRYLSTADAQPEAGDDAGDAGADAA